jgi:hypothetical protein
MSVMMVTKGTPGSAVRKLSHMARLKLGTRETTMSGRLLRQKSTSMRTCFEWNSRMTRCMPAVSCGEPSVQPLRSIVL